MLANTKKAVLLMDSSKLGNTAFCSICGVSDIDILITDKEPDGDWMQYLAGKGVQTMWR